MPYLNTLCGSPGARAESNDPNDANFAAIVLIVPSDRTRAVCSLIHSSATSNSVFEFEIMH